MVELKSYGKKVLRHYQTSLRGRILLLAFGTFFLTYGAMGSITGVLSFSVFRNLINLIEERDREATEAALRQLSNFHIERIASYKRSAENKAAQLITKEAELLLSFALENSYSAIRQSLINTYQNDPEFIQVSFIVPSSEGLRFWQWVSPQYPQGLPITNHYDRNRKRWEIKQGDSSLFISDPEIEKNLATKDIRIFEHNITLQGKSTPVLELIYPLYESALNTGEQPIAYLRYIYSLESLFAKLEFEKEGLKANLTALQAKHDEALKKIKKDQAETILLVQVLLGSLSLALLVFTYYRTSRVSHEIVKPLTRLSESVDQISSGNYDLAVATRDAPFEIERLAKNFEQMRLTVKVSIENLALELQTKESMVADLAHKGNNPLHASNLARMDIANKIDKIESIIKEIYSDAVESDQELMESLKIWKDIIQELREDDKIMDQNFRRIAQAIAEIRVLGRIDGNSLDMICFQDIWEAALARVIEAQGQQNFAQMSLDVTGLSNFYILTNRQILLIVLDHLLSQWFLDVTSSFTVVIRPLYSAPGLEFFRIGAHGQKLHEDEFLLKRLDHIIKDYAIRLSFDKDSRVICLYALAEALLDDVA